MVVAGSELLQHIGYSGDSSDEGSRDGNGDSRL